MTNLKRAIGIAAQASLFLLILFLPPAAHGQVVVPGLRPGGNLATFGDFAYRHPDIGKQSIYGYTIGGYLQTSHLLGLEIRGSALPYGGYDKQYSALAGPRVAFHFSRFVPYVAALGGVGHVRVEGELNGKFVNSLSTSSIAPEWDLVGGVDWSVGHHVSVRVGEITYSRIYILQHGLTPMTYSTGLVYRLPNLSLPFIH